MIKRPFFGFGKPKLSYGGMEALEQASVEEIALPPKVTLFLKHLDVTREDLALSLGAPVRTGQKLKLTKRNDPYVIATATGSVSDISERTGYLGRSFPAVTIEAAEKDQWNEALKENKKTSVPEKAHEFLSTLPGALDMGNLLKAYPPLNTLVINGMDEDLLVATNQFHLKNEIDNLTRGVSHLKTILPSTEMIMVASPILSAEAAKTGADVRVVPPTYPNMLSKILLKKVLGKVAPYGRDYSDMGVGFLSAEAVASLGRAFETGRLPVDKTFTLIGKDGTARLVRARIGTPVGHVLSALNIETGQGDRIILGGPMMGQALYSEDWPVSGDTNALMIQDEKQVEATADTHCVNCGECVRACPANIPVNMLVRLLENGLYEEAVEDYDLLSCVECGICSYVCIARIPLLHYIMLGKHEFAQKDLAEEFDA